jgi:1-acyl-sn-glycerol-3-phosphate acyltransferase
MTETDSRPLGPVLQTSVAAIRSLMAYVLVSLYILVAGPIGIILAVAFKWPNVLYLLGLWGVRLALLLVGIRYDVTGDDNLLIGRAAVYCVNHASNVEPPVIYSILRRLFPKLRVLYKAELHRIPILSHGFDVVGFVPIERGNREQSMRAIERAAEALRDGHSFMIFPEGTRSRTGELLPFKKGGFIMAIKGQVPIVPVAIQGARAAMRKGSPIVRPVRITVQLGKPVETAGLELTDRDRIISEVRTRMQAMLHKGMS